jgi:import receptor subunit TOM22
MVKVEEVHDEDLLPRPSDDPSRPEDDWATDSDNESVSSADSTSSDRGVAHESLADRLYALRDMLPPRARRALTRGASATVSAAKTTAGFGGRALWVISTSALLLGLPLALAMAEEQEIEAQEQQAKMAQTAGDVSLSSLDCSPTNLSSS